MKKNNKMNHIFLLVFLSLMSCNERSQIGNSQMDVKVNINLPSSIPVDKYIEGEILYKSNFDTLKLNENERRYITLYLAKSKNRIQSINELKKMQMDTFVSISNNIIPIFDLKFNEKGEMFLEGFIIDEIYLNNTDQEVYKVKTLETKITHSIIVQ